MVLSKPRFYFLMLTVVLVQTSTDSAGTFGPRPHFSVQPPKTSILLPKLLKVDETDLSVQYYLKNSTGTYNPNLVTIPPLSICQVFPNARIPFHGNCVALELLQPNKNNEKEVGSTSQNVASALLRHRPRFTVHKLIDKSVPSELQNYAAGGLDRPERHVPFPILMRKGLHKIVKKDLSQHYYKARSTNYLYGSQAIGGSRKIRDMTTQEASVADSSSIVEDESSLTKGEAFRGNSLVSQQEEVQYGSPVAANQSMLKYPTTDPATKTEHLNQTQAPQDHHNNKTSDLSTTSQSVEELNKKITVVVNYAVVLFMMTALVGLIMWIVSLLSKPITRNKARNTTSSS